MPRSVMSATRVVWKYRVGERRAQVDPSAGRLQRLLKVPLQGPNPATAPYIERAVTRGSLSVGSRCGQLGRPTEGRGALGRLAAPDATSVLSALCPAAAASRLDSDVRCAMELTTEEGRVLGCLVEKQLTTPQQYPLTDNALIAACNQTTNRDPVVAYDVATVRMAVRSLREKGLLRTVHRTGERSDKHQHLLDIALALSSGQVALLAVLLLRGPQTLAELRARTERMHPFDTLDQVQEALDSLTDRDDPLVTRLERQPGRKEARYGQLLVDSGQTHAGPAPESAAPDGLTLVGLAREVELLRAELEEVRTQVQDLRQPHSEG